MDRILRAVETARAEGRQVAIRMVGDRRQLQPIGGPGLRIVTDAIGAQRVDTIVRQRQDWAREMVGEFGKGNAEAGLKYLTDRGHFRNCDGPVNTARFLVDAWQKYRSEQPERTSLMIARTNRQVQAINDRARETLRVSREIGQSDLCQLTAATPSGQSHPLSLAAGERIRFLTRNDHLGVINGTTGRLLDVTSDAAGNMVLRAEVEGRAISFTPADLADDQGRIQVAHAYATTCYGSQGLTTDHTFLLADATMDRHDIFVSASRHRDGLDVFVDTKDLDSRAKAARLLSDRERPVSDEERQAIMAQAFSRSGMRASTLDYLPPRGVEHAQTIEVGDRERNRSPQVQKSRGVSHEL
jgi:ATP-dependent exoDNAse (exonuclease V) alpha subunit